ncbi:hypothetical protein HZS_644 [Henneguya salminicola]|nr:hypothetical protein HZS_644 [Henneguya salminicola]
MKEGIKLVASLNVGGKYHKMNFFNKNIFFNFDFVMSFAISKLALVKCKLNSSTNSIRVLCKIIATTETTRLPTTIPTMLVINNISSRIDYKVFRLPICQKFLTRDAEMGIYDIF